MKYHILVALALIVLLFIVLTALYVYLAQTISSMIGSGFVLNVLLLTLIMLWLAFIISLVVLIYEEISYEENQLINE